MSKVNNPRVALAKVPFNTIQYKDHLERVLEQLYARSGGGTSGISTLSDELATLTTTVNGVQPQIDSLSNDQDALTLAVTQLQTDLATANAAISTLQTSLASAEANITQQGLDIADLQTRVTALENP